MPVAKIELVIISLVFGLAGLAKILGLQFEVQAFEQWGFPAGFMYFVGILELAGAIGIWLRKLAPFVALCLGGLALGALITRLLFMEWVAAVVTFAVLAITLHFVWIRRRELFPR